MKREQFIIANWKMTLDLSQVERFLSRFDVDEASLKKVNVVLSPSFVFIPRVKELIGNQQIYVAGQNLFWEDKGAFTGEVSARQLVDAGATFVIIGHSERRESFNETDEMVNKKIKIALSHKLIPIVCFGESYEEKESGQTKQIVEQHVQGCLQDLESRDVRKVILAYEPVWAISTNVHNTEKKTDSPESAQVVHKLVRRVVADMFDESVANALSVAYGGSVTGDSVGDFAAMDDIDGVLVGGASKEPDSFMAVVNNFLSSMSK